MHILCICICICTHTHTHTHTHTLVLVRVFGACECHYGRQCVSVWCAACAHVYLRACVCVCVCVCVGVVLYACDHIAQRYMISLSVSLSLRCHRHTDHITGGLQMTAVDEDPRGRRSTATLQRGKQDSDKQHCTCCSSLRNLGHYDRRRYRYISDIVKKKKARASGRECTH